MARGVVGVREARAGDMPALVELWGELRRQGLRWFGRPKTAESAAAVESRFRTAIDDPAYRLVVAHVGEDIAGMALFRLAPPSPLNDVPAVEVTHICVGDRHRRQGAGMALVQAAVAYADEHGCENVVVAVLPQQRDAHRFYARLGFAPMAVRRIAPTAALRRRLTPPEGRAAVLRRGSLAARPPRH